jgi:hypothetical protein
LFIMHTCSLRHKESVLLGNVSVCDHLRASHGFLNLILFVIFQYDVMMLHDLIKIVF